MSDSNLIYCDVDVFQDALDAAIGDAEKATKQAIMSTMAKVRKNAVTRMSDLIRERWAIAKKDLDKKIAVRISDKGERYEAFEMTIKGISVSLSYFNAKQFSGMQQVTRSKTVTKARRSKFQGVQVTVVKGRQVKMANAFMQRAANGHMMVMRRTAKGRYPVDIKASISVASMFNQARTADRFENETMEFLERTFAHELSWRLQQAGLQ